MTRQEIMKDLREIRYYYSRIVKQRIDIEVDMEDDNVLISYDTYYVRTQKRDKEYEYGMSEKQNIDGKRMRTSMYARRYVE